MHRPARRSTRREKISWSGRPRPRMVVGAPTRLVRREEWCATSALPLTRRNDQLTSVPGVTPERRENRQRRILNMLGAPPPRPKVYSISEQRYNARRSSSAGRGIDADEANLFSRLA